MSGDPQSYTLSIDWFSAGSYPNNSDANYLLRYSIVRGRDQVFTGDPVSGEAKLARARVGQLTLTLDNSSGRYDTYNANSALYPYVTPGKIVRLQVTDDLANTYTLFTGSIDDIRPTYGSDKTVQITCSDAWKPLSQSPMSTSMYTNNDVSKPMLEIAGYAVASKALAGYDVQTGSDNYPYIWGDEDTPYQVLHDLAEMDGGFCHIDVAGYFRFISRANATAQIPTLTLDQSQVLRDILISQPWDDIINYVVIGIHDRTRNPNQVMVWTTPDVGRIDPGQTLTRRIRYTGANGKLVPIRSLAGADGSIFNMPAQDRADGLGNIVTGLPNLVRTIPPGGAVALQVSLTNTKTYPIYLLFGSAAANNLCGGKLFSHPLDDLNPSEHALSDAVSIALHGTRTLRLNYQYMQGVNNANNLAAYYLLRFKNPKATITVKLQNRSTIQFAYDLNALLNFTSSYLTGRSTLPTTKASTIVESINNPNSTCIANPGFETGDNLGWNIGAGATGFCGVSSAVFRSGAYALKLDYVATLLQSYDYSASAAFSFWLNIPAEPVPKQWFYLYVYTVGGVGGTSLFFQQQGVTAGWTQFSGTLALNPGGTGITIYGYLTNGTVNYPAYVDDFSVLGASCKWENISNVTLADNNGARAFSWRESSNHCYTSYLKLTGFGFAFQPTDVINGIVIKIRKKTIVSPPASPGYTGGSVDYAVQLVKGGVISGNNKAKPETWTTQFEDYIYGSNADLWGLTLTYADVSASNFGVAISAKASLCNGDRGWAEAHVDYVEMTVYTSNGAFQSAYRIAGIKHETGVSTKEVTTTWLLEPQVNSSNLRSPDQVISSPSAGEQFPIIGGITY